VIWALCSTPARLSHIRDVLVPPACVICAQSVVSSAATVLPDCLQLLGKPDWTTATLFLLSAAADLSTIVESPMQTVLDLGPCDHVTLMPLCRSCIGFQPEKESTDNCACLLCTRRNAPVLRKIGRRMMSNSRV